MAVKKNKHNRMCDDKMKLVLTLLALAMLAFLGIHMLNQQTNDKQNITKANIGAADVRRTADNTREKNGSAWLRSRRYCRKSDHRCAESGRILYFK